MRTVTFPRSLRWAAPLVAAARVRPVRLGVWVVCELRTMRRVRAAEMSPQQRARERTRSLRSMGCRGRGTDGV